MERFSFKIPEQLDERLDEIIKETGLSKAEIGRRGLLNEINKLENQVEV